MSTNGFREDELVTRRLNGQTRVFPVVGGRLRLAHEENENLSLQTEMVSWDGQYAVFRCTAITQKGEMPDTALPITREMPDSQRAS